MILGCKKNLTLMSFDIKYQHKSIKVLKILDRPDFNFLSNWVDTIDIKRHKGEIYL